MTETNTRSDQQYKASVRREWAMGAPGWERGGSRCRSRGRGPGHHPRASRGQADLKEGDSVLDVGSGYGEPGLSAAAAVGPTGHVTCLDISGDMLAFAEGRARRAGLANVEFVEADIESRPLDPVSFDAVLSRAVLMYASDPLGTLRRLRRALRPGGRIAIAVWGTPDTVAFSAPVRDGGARHRASAAGPGPFALGETGAGRARSSAGFDDVRSGTAVASTSTDRRGVHPVAPRRRAADHGARRQPARRPSRTRCGRGSPTPGRPSRGKTATSGCPAPPCG